MISLITFTKLNILVILGFLVKMPKRSGALKNEFSNIEELSAFTKRVFICWRIRNRYFHFCIQDDAYDRQIRKRIRGGTYGRTNMSTWIQNLMPVKNMYILLRVSRATSGFRLYWIIYNCIRKLGPAFLLSV